MEELKELVQGLAVTVFEIKERMDDDIGSANREVIPLKDFVNSITARLEALEARLADGAGNLPLTEEIRVREESPQPVAGTSWSGAEESFKSKIKLPTFDGSTPWSVYRVQLEAAAECNRWSQHETAVHLLMSLKGPALELLQGVDQKERCNLATIMELLDARYGERHLASLRQRQLLTRRQRQGESIQDFEADIARLSQLVYSEIPIKVRESLSTETFLKGLLNGDLEEKVRLMRPKSSKEALGMALELEACQQACGTKRPVRELALDEEAVEQIVHRVFQKNRKGLCYRCNKPGHFARECKERRREAEN